MDTHDPAPLLAYAVPVTKRPRRWRTLPASVAIAVVVCGTIMAAAPSIMLCAMHVHSEYGVADYVMALLWATAGSGLFVILLGIFLAAPSRGRLGKSAD